MNPRTRFLSRLFGLYCLVMGIAMALHRDTFLGTIESLVHDRPLVFIVGVVSVFAGLSLVLAHNIWRGGVLALLVTLLGWITLAKGLLFLLLAPNAALDFHLGTLENAGRYYGYAALTFVLGLYLVVSGFRPGPGLSPRLR